MSADGFDAVIVGAGPNGLVGAAVLARAGLRVLVLEAADRVGGALRTEELTLPGFHHDVGATVLPLAIASPAFRALAPAVTWAQPDVPVAHPLDDGTALVHRDVAATVEAVGDPGWGRIVGPVVHGGDALGDALLSPLSPGVAVGARGALVRYGLTAALPARTVARRLLHTPEARAAFAGMAAHSVLRLDQVSTAGYGTFMAGLAHRVGWPVVVGGSERLAEALAAELATRGAELTTGHTVRDFADVPSAPITLLDLTPRQVLGILGHRVPGRYARALQRFRYGPAVFKLDWALDGPVPWRDPRVGDAVTVHLGGTFEEIEHSEREVAAGRVSERPFVIVVQPCVADPSRAPAGKHTLWAYCHVPNGYDGDAAPLIEAQLERFAPGFAARVLARSVHTPGQLQQWDANLVGGDIGGGSADIRQFVARPRWSPAPWRTPLPGVYLCSSSTPPGGGVHGMGGWHAARLALRDRG
jgi:phytoene dehydrogenase-like protein